MVIKVIEVVPIVALLAVALLLLISTRAWLFILIFLAFSALPESFPNILGIGPVQLAVYQVWLILGALVALIRYRSQLVTDVSALVIIGVTITFQISGLLHGASVHRISEDTRLLIVLATAMFIAGRVLVEPQMQQMARISVLVTLWSSCILVMASSRNLVVLNGRYEDASLNLSGSLGDSGSIRILSACTHPAAITLAVCAALCVLRPQMLMRCLPYIVPALVITLFAYSRNAVVLSVVTLLVAPIFSRDAKSFVRSVVTVGVGCMVFWITGPALRYTSDIPVLGNLDALYTVYSKRVLNGLAPGTQAIDASVLYRRGESVDLWQSIKSHEILGHGFGFRYRIGVGHGFTSDEGTYYAHQYYLWTWAKTGVLGLMAYVGAYSAPLLRLLSIREASPISSALAGSGVALLVVSAVAPMPLSVNGAPLLGAILGAALALRTRNQNHADIGEQIHHVGVSPRKSQTVSAS